MVLKKGKRLKLGKLRIIQLIKVDFQMLIRVFINDRTKHNIENDERISKENYELYQGYYIDNLILEKQLLNNCSI